MTRARTGRVGPTPCRHHGLEPVGNYALRIQFDDMHDSGIFSWKYLYELGEHQDELWAEYLEELEKRGLKRDPR